MSLKLNDRFATLEHSLASLTECIDKLAKRLDALGPMNQRVDIVISEGLGIATNSETVAEVVVFDSSVIKKIEDTLNNLLIMVMDLLTKIDNAGLVPVALSS
ncbi:hypothetical protein G9A89_014017 [Geosiphon pyriformis]|nr:hypothetical protein G9A89_014017 [Geosiphon pyriformis]